VEFEELVKRFSPYIRYLASKTYIPSSVIDKEDLYQEILFSLWKRWKNKELEDKTDGYIRGSCYFHLKNYLRCHKEKARIVSLNEPVGEGGTLEDMIPDQKPLIPERLDDAIFIQQMKEKELTRREKEVTEFLSQGYTLRDIGKKLGISHVRVLKIKENIGKKFKKGVTKGGKFLL